MSEMLPTLYIARHAEIAWSLSGQYTGLTDLPPPERGQSNARRLGNQLREWTFAQVFSSPLRICAVIAALGLLCFGIAFTRFRRRLVQIQT